MTRRVRTLLILTAAAAAAVVFFVLATLPPRPERLPAAPDEDLARRTIPGGYHIHTTRSDGMADKAAVAAAASRAGLKFAIFTDHGDATLPPDPPIYLDGVLCIDGVEISTDEGHYVAIGMPPSPFPLGGAASAVVEDVARLGGFGIAAHPDSPKPSLRWRDTASAVDGLEWLSADSEWRDESRPALFRALVDYLVRPAPAIASLLDRPGASLARWDALTRERRVVALAAHDAHGGIGGALEDGERAWVARVPSYDTTFRSMATRIVVDRPLTGDAGADARLVLEALRAGRVFSVVTAVAAPAALDFHLRSGGGHVAMGESTVFSGPAVLIARATVPAGSRTVLLRDGSELAAVAGGSIEHPITAAGVYRVEVRASQAPGHPPVPWLVSNPIYLRPAASAEAAPVPRGEVLQDLSGLAWRTEHDPGSRATASSGADLVRLEYSLQAGERASQFAAIVTDLPAPPAAFDAVLFTAEASAPTRVSVQLRFGDREQRWGRSVYVDTRSRTVLVPVGDMRPAGRSAAAPPDASTATALLFVIDLTNAAPGTSGWLAIRRPALGVLVK